MEEFIFLTRIFLSEALHKWHFTYLHTVLESSDKLILCGKSHEKISGVHLYEHTVSDSDLWCGKKILEISSPDELILMIKRKGRLIIPDGNTIISENDVIITNKGL